MPQASAGIVKYWLQDHDTALVNEDPPTQNQWYTVVDDEDVRIIWFVMYQTNEEQAGKDIEVRWTLDGTTYFLQCTLADDTPEYIYRFMTPSNLGTGGLNNTTNEVNAAFYVDKRALDALLEVRMTSAPGTGQVLTAWCVYETLELT